MMKNHKSSDFGILIKNPNKIEKRIDRRKRCSLNETRRKTLLSTEEKGEEKEEELK